MSNANHPLIRLRPVHGVAALVAALALVASACSSDGGGTKDTKSASDAGSSAGGAQADRTTSTSASPTKPPATPVSIKTVISDGDTYGVGMPVIIYFSKKIKSAKAFQAATKVTADGKPLTARWYFEYSSAGNGPVEAHLRPQQYWRPHSKIHVTFPKSGTALGAGLALKTKLTSLDFSIGPRHLVTVDDSDNEVTVLSDGKNVGRFKTSLGAPNSEDRTKRGIKVIMEKRDNICMQDLRGTYRDCGIRWTQRLTYDGEYLHAAPWNTRNIANGVNSSNGCTNLTTTDAKQLYDLLRVGDVVSYPNADGARMQLGQGYGDWNVNWSEWQSGGLVSTQ